MRFTLTFVPRTFHCEYSTHITVCSLVYQLSFHYPLSVQLLLTIGLLQCLRHKQCCYQNLVPSNSVYGIHQVTLSNIEYCYNFPFNYGHFNVISCDMIM